MGAPSDVHRVVVVGAGFAGLTAAQELAGAPVDVTIIDRRNFHLFQPLLYQVATAALNPSDIAYPIRSVFRRQHNVRRVLLGEVDAIDREAREVHLADGATVGYDSLILATGATHSYFGHDEWASRAPGLKTIEDALLVRRRILHAFERAERKPDRAAEELTFVVVGGGPTGVELAGAIEEIAVHALQREFDAIDPSTARVVLVEGAGRVLPGYPEHLSDSARRQLEELGVEVRTGRLVSDIDDDGVTLDDGSRIESRTVLWAAGVQASPVAATIGTELDGSGRVRVAADLSVEGSPEVFVVGDLASVTDRGERVPGVAPAAMQQGRHAARQILSDLTGRKRKPFRYRDKGSLATIGRARAVADLGPLEFGGFGAWMAWLGIHIVYLIGFRNRLFVILSWAWSYLTFRRGVRIITEVEPSDDG